MVRIHAEFESPITNNESRFQIDIRPSPETLAPGGGVLTMPMANLLTAFTTGKAAYDLLEPIVTRLFTRLGWKKEDKRRALVSERMRTLVADARVVVANSPPELAGAKLQALVDRLRDELLVGGVPVEDAQIFVDQASSVLIMVAFGSIEEWFAIRSRLAQLEERSAESAKLEMERAVAFDLKLSRLSGFAFTAIGLAATALVLAMIYFLRR